MDITLKGGIERFIANNLIRKDFYNIMRREHSPMSLIRIKIISSSNKWSEIVDISITTFSYSGWIFRLADILYLPGTIALYLKRQLKKIKLFKRPP